MTNCLCFGAKKIDDHCFERLFGYISDAKEIEKASETLRLRYIEGRYPISETIEKNIPAAANLHRTEKMILHGYTNDLFLPLNRALRIGGETYRKWKEVIHVGASALNKLRPFWEFKGTVFRLEDVRLKDIPMVLKTYQQGNLVIEPSFLSTAQRPVRQPSSWEEITITYIIESEHGIAIDKISLFSHESEVLFTPGSVFEVKELEYLPGPSSSSKSPQVGDAVMIKLVERNLPMQGSDIKK